jgi:gliding motility-associated-like protein
MAGGYLQTTAGTYSDTIRTVAGACDSIITNTDLRVITTTTVKQRIDSCFRATIKNVTYTSDAIVRDTIHSVCGLDSVIIIDTLHIFDPSISISSSLALPIIDGESTQLTISPSGNYQNIIWSPNYDISNIYAVAPLVDPARDTIYYVTAEDSNHCQVSAQIYISVVGTDLPEFIMPTAFSPNDDGKNDIYRPVIKTNGTFEILAFQIYDRWGEMVFDKNVTGTSGWDGTYKNTKQPIGVYVYFINVKTSAGGIIKQNGNLTLLR